MAGFHDHFSDDSTGYRDARPTYPAALFAWLAEQTPGRSRAWDCACGNGQASVPLADCFDEVVATDASSAQLKAAHKRPNIEYRLATAEDSGLEDGSVDIVTCAQAAHWFDHEAFHHEVRRVLKSGGLLAVWTYSIHSVSTEIDPITDKYYKKIVGPFWPPERNHVDELYSNLPFPFDKIATPEFQIELQWDLGQFLAYIRSWSSSRLYREHHGTDPIDLVLKEFQTAWGDKEVGRTVRWPLTVIAGHADST